MNKILCGCGCKSVVKYPGAKFCHGHHLRLQRYQRKPNNPIINICSKCKIQFISKKSHTVKQKYCSRSCSQISKKNGIFKECINCKKQFYITPYRIKENSSRGKFCSNECRLIHWSIEAKEKESAGSYRQNAWKVYEKKCYDCGIKDERILIIHHIDGNRKNGLINNLIPVCHNCHCLRHISLNNHKIISFSK